MSYQTAHVDELDRIPVDQGLEWRPVRRRFDIQAFGVNAYTAEKIGAPVVEEHTETMSGHEELYVVVRRVHLLVADREPGAAADDDVELLVSVRRLGVFLDDPVADLLRRVGVGAEGLDAEAARDGAPLEPVLDRDAVELVEMCRLVRHAFLRVSSTTGSSRSAPSRRSSRFSVPAQRRRAEGKSPS